ncbi:hypothetical protein SDIAM26S_01436 [Streptomyces diastaticus subsp. diastaticus]
MPTRAASASISAGTAYPVATTRFGSAGMVISPLSALKTRVFGFSPALSSTPVPQAVTPRASARARTPARSGVRGERGRRPPPGPSKAADGGEAACEAAATSDGELGDMGRVSFGSGAMSGPPGEATELG